MKVPDFVISPDNDKGRIGLRAFTNRSFAEVILYEDGHGEVLILRDGEVVGKHEWVAEPLNRRAGICLGNCAERDECTKGYKP